MKNSYALIVALSLSCTLLLSSCTEKKDPTDPNGNTPTEIVMTKMTGMPNTGGDVKAVAFAGDGAILSIINGKIYRIGGPGESPGPLGPTESQLTVAVAPSGEIYGATDKGLRVYSSSGATLSETPYSAAGPLIAGRRVESAHFVFSPTGVPFVVLINNYPSSFVYYTTDKGATWTEVVLKNAVGQNVVIQTSADIGFAPNGDMYLAMPSLFYGLAKTSDMGATWTKLPGAIENGVPRMMVTTAGWIYTWIPEAGALSVSKDGGMSFTLLTQNNRPPMFTEVVEGPGGTLLGIAGALGVVKSTDGGANWKTVVNAQGKNLAVRGNTIAVANSFGAASTGGGVLISSDAGAKWQLSGLTLMETCDAFAFDADNNLLIVGGNTLFRRTGSTWSAIGVNAGFVSLATTPKGQILTGAPGNMIYSGDNGQTWTVSTDFPGYTVGIGTIAVPVIHGKRNGDFLLSVCTYRFDLSRYVGGTIYTVGASGMPLLGTAPSSYPVTSIIEDNNGNIWAGTEIVDANGQYSGEVFKSTDGGNSWVMTGTSPGNARAINSQGTAFSIGGDTHYQIGELGSTTQRALTLTGFTSLPQSIKAVKFGSDDKLYILTSDQGIFVSQSAVR